MKKEVCRVNEHEQENQSGGCLSPYNKRYPFYYKNNMIKLSYIAEHGHYIMDWPDGEPEDGEELNLGRKRKEDMH